MSNFFFSHSVFKRLVSQGRQKVSLCGDGLTQVVSYTGLAIPVFLHVCNTHLLKTLWEPGKIEIACNYLWAFSNFSFAYSIFYVFEELLIIFSIKFKIVVCKLFQSGKILIFVVWIKVNPFPHNDTFWHPWQTSLLKTLWEKEKLLVTSNFSFSHSVFFPFG